MMENKIVEVDAMTMQIIGRFLKRIHYLAIDNEELVMEEIQEILDEGSDIYMDYILNRN